MGPDIPTEPTPTVVTPESTIEQTEIVEPIVVEDAPQMLITIPPEIAEIYTPDDVSPAPGTPENPGYTAESAAAIAKNRFIQAQALAVRLTPPSLEERAGALNVPPRAEPTPVPDRPSTTTDLS